MSDAVGAIVAFGANLGDRDATIRAAAADLAAADGVEAVELGPILESVAVRLDGVDHTAPAYLNTVARVRTTLDPAALHAVLRAIEDAHGRVRAERWGYRTLDLDLIVFGEVTQGDPELTIPHPRAHERAFVLVPWLALDPDAVLPGLGRVDALPASAPVADGVEG